jgi:predicted DNA-binding ribbon-helix-helix protein
MRKLKGNWGGRRPGAGRKPTLDNPVSFTGDIERADMNALEEIAEMRGTSVASLIRVAVTAYVKRQMRRSK